MTTIGIAMVKDEHDVVKATVEHMLTQVDHVVIADNASTDGTREILEQLPVDLIDDPEVGYYQSFKMTRLARHAECLGAKWIVPFDADEFWYSPFGRIGDVLSECPSAVAAATLFDHVPTAEDQEDGDHIARIGWRRREAGPLPKVACRPAIKVTIHQGNHGASFDGGPPTENLLVIRHFPYRSAEQFETKARNGAAAYAATDLPEDHGAHWRGYGRILESEGAEALEHNVFRKYFWAAEPHADHTLIFDPAPRS